ncbi:hypothetical protein OF897_15445 [Chryseobacterium formosus]|uniref:Uncharacterized protein n=1 Tax=Chryseobacterium formosus TaxID=1537363 RepID=A0ABT3XUI8_9FLAO|nr:hypothetical protein [Chryseobacterium formosus]MCX8525312.1 hypothetical protein [Chryseobacterium formosus]
MKKNKNPISKCVKLLGTTWKLGSFVLLFFILLSSSLFATENYPSSETVVHSEPSPEIDQHQKPVVFVTEGTVIYGMENMSQKTEFKASEETKTDKKASTKKIKSIAVSKKIIQKVKIEREIQKLEATAHISSHQSENSFEVSKQRYGVGTLTINNSFKAAILKDIAKISVPVADNTNSSYEYCVFFKGTKIELFSFTRPPPFS